MPFIDPVSRRAVLRGVGTTLALPLLDTYSDAKPGDYLALINSFGVVEIARSEGNAAKGLGAERGAPVVVTT